MIDFYADWCIYCIQMEERTFPDPGVQRALSNVYLVQADVSANDDDDKAVLKRFKLFGPPALLIFAPDGKEVRNLRVVGYQDGDAFAATINRARESWSGQ